MWTQVSENNDTHMDAIAFLINARVEAGNREAKPVLNEIARDTKVGKLRTCSKGYAEYLYTPSIKQFSQRVVHPLVGHLRRQLPSVRQLHWCQL